jgi:glycosyltransferase involved in cell wall biosynthesis
VRLVIDGQRLTAARTGVGRCLEALLAEWATTGWPLDEVLLVGKDPAGLERLPETPGLARVVVGDGWPGLVWETFALGRILRRDDVLLAPANLVPWNWHGPTVSILYDTLPWSVPDSFPWHVRLRFGWRYRLAAKRADRVVVPSESTARDVARVHGLPADRMSVVYPGPEPRFRPLMHDSPEVVAAREAAGLGDAPFILFVGKRSRRRNVPALLAAFAAHRERFPAHRLVFVGPRGGVPLPGAGSGVIECGHVSEDVLHGLLASALALAYPSDHEGFGLPVVEAMACACPVVTLRNSALGESGGAAAFYLDSASAGQIARALDTLAADPRCRDEFSRRGLEHVRRFSRASFARGVADEIRRLVADIRFDASNRRDRFRWSRVRLRPNRVKLRRLQH